MARKVAKAGDSILEHVTASWINEQNLPFRLPPQAPPKILSENPIKVRCEVYPESSSEFTRYQVAFLFDPLIFHENFDSNDLRYNTVGVQISQNDGSPTRHWGIVQGPCLTGQPSEIVVLGLTWALFDYTDGDTHVDTNEFDELVSGMSGKAQIVAAPWEPGLPGLILIKGGTSGTKIFLATTEITARSGTTVGTGTGTEYKIVGTTLTTNTNTEDLVNITAVAIPSGMYVLATREDLTGFWVVQHPGIINLRLDGSNLQYTLDGTTWTTWTTAVAC